MAHFKVKALHFVFEIPIYTQDVLFIFGYSRMKASAIITRYGGTLEASEFIRNLKSCKGVCTQDGQSGRFLIYMEDLPRTSSEHGSLIHELFHLVEQIMDRVGMKHEPYISSEAYAYLLGQVTAEVLARLWTATNSF